MSNSLTLLDCLCVQSFLLVMVPHLILHQPMSFHHSSVALHFKGFQSSILSSCDHPGYSPYSATLHIYVRVKFFLALRLDLLESRRLLLRERLLQYMYTTNKKCICTVAELFKSKSAFHTATHIDNMSVSAWTRAHTHITFLPRALL